MDSLEAYFAPISNAIQVFASARNLHIERYRQGSPIWEIEFRHPKGGDGTVLVARVSELLVNVSSSWSFSDYDTFTQYIHWAQGRDVTRAPQDIGAALEVEELEPNYPYPILDIHD